MEKILIISYTFPPNAGIGGRRWAKFAKYFHRTGTDIHVLAANSSLTGNNYKDISEYQSKISYLPSLYPKYLGIQPKTLLEKVLYRLSLIYSKIRIPGNYYDKGAYWQNNFLKEVEKKIQEGYKTIVVTVAPFSIAYTVSKIIPKYPDVHFIVDFRDPWLNNETSYGFAGLNTKRKAYEKEAEKKVIDLFKTVVSVSDPMNEYFINTYKADTGKFYTISNGFDKDDLLLVNNQTNDLATFKLVFTGTFYGKARYQLNLLKNALDQLKLNNSDLYPKINFHFYGPCDFNTQFITDFHKTVQFHGIKTPAEIQLIIQQSDAGMLFLTDDITYSFSTKFCEYMAYKKPVVVFSTPGETGDFVVKNNIGMHINTLDFTTSFNELLDKIQKQTLVFNPQFNTDTFNVEVLANKYLNIIRSKNR